MTVREYLQARFPADTDGISQFELEAYISKFEGQLLTLQVAHLLSRYEIRDLFGIPMGHALLLEQAFQDYYRRNNINNINDININSNMSNINAIFAPLLSALATAVGTSNIAQSNAIIPSNQRRQEARRIPKQEQIEVIEIDDDDVGIKEEDQVGDANNGAEGNHIGSSSSMINKNDTSSISFGAAQPNAEESMTVSHNQNHIEELPRSRRQCRDEESGNDDINFARRKKPKVAEDQNAYNNNKNVSIRNNNLAARSLDAELKPMQEMVTKLMNNRPHNGGLFNKPVDPVAHNVPDYYEIITNPMDLGTVKEKLENKQYQSRAQVCADIRLVFSNAMSYNPPFHEVYHAADALQIFFNREYQRLESSADNGNTNKKKSKGKTSNHKGVWSDDERKIFFTCFLMYRNDWKKFEKDLKGRKKRNIREWAKRAFVEIPKKTKQKGFGMLYNNQATDEAEFVKSWSEFSAYYKHINHGFEVPQPKHTSMGEPVNKIGEEGEEDGENQPVPQGQEKEREKATVAVNKTKNENDDEDDDNTVVGGDDCNDGDDSDEDHSDDDPSMEQWKNAMGG